MAVLPSRGPLAQKIDGARRGGNAAGLVWTTRYHAWPFSTEYLSALFDYNVAPFFQSFVEVRVERSTGRVRLMPYGIHGRLRWRDLSRSTVITTASGNADDFAEWVVPMR